MANLFTPDKEDLQESRNGRRDIRHTRSARAIIRFGRPGF